MRARNPTPKANQKSMAEADTTEVHTDLRNSSAGKHWCRMQACTRRNQSTPKPHDSAADMPVD